MSIFEVNNLSLTLNKKMLIKHLNFTCHAGEVWGVIGPNGVGKTTLLHTLAGLKKTTTGDITIDAKNIFSMKARERAKKIGLLTQHIYFPFPSSVLETVLIGRYPYSKHWFSEQPEDIEIAKQALSLMDLGKLANRPVNHLSGGEQRRLTLAMMLAQNPEIYLLDEPTTHLDLQQRIHTLSLLRKLAKEAQKIIILVLHDIHLIRMFCDKVILFGKAEKQRIGPCAEIINRAILRDLFSDDLLDICGFEI